MAPTEPYPTHSANQDNTKKDLSSWWKNFKRGGEKRKEDDKHGEAAHESHDPPGIFGIPLVQSVRYANVAISLTDPNGQSYIYGYVPIVVAKCGVFLKEKATDVEGIFRLSGSEKRIKELRNAFNSPDRYGKGLDWTGYTVHDAANILRRYFNQLPEPIIPLNFYEHFRNPLRNHQSQAVGPMEGQSPSQGDFVVGDAIKTYQTLIKQLPPLNRQLLLYILDLLAVFASKADQNKMTTPNLAAIFQPGILSHPSHDMAPSEYRLSQDVLIFLIEHQDHFLIGMQGTAADEKTVQEVESGPPTPKNHSSTSRAPNAAAVLRSSSNSSKYSGVRRSASASSRRSKASAAQGMSPAGSEPHTPTGGMTGSGVHRSNTLPSTRSPNLTHGRFGKDKQGGNQTPPSSIPENTQTQPEQAGRPVLSTESRLHSQSVLQEVMTTGEDVQANITNPPSALSQGLAGGAATAMAADASRPTQSVQIPTAASGSSKLADSASPQSAASSNGPRPLSSFFSSRATPDGRKPNKLQKKRSPLPSAHSSTNDLTEPEPLPVVAGAGSLPTAAQLTPLAEHRSIPQDELPLRTPPPISDHYRGAGSPTVSNMSMSDADVPAGQDILSASFDSRDSSHMESAKKRHWFSRKADSSQSNQQLALGTNGQAGASRSSVLSSEGRKSLNVDSRRSINMERIQSANEPAEAGFAGVGDGEREGRRDKNPISWLKGKLGRDRSREDKRLVSPSRDAALHPDTQHLGAPSSTIPVVHEHTMDGQHLTPEPDVSGSEKKASTPDTIVPDKKEVELGAAPAEAAAALTATTEAPAVQQSERHKLTKPAPPHVQAQLQSQAQPQSQAPVTSASHEPVEAAQQHQTMTTADGVPSTSSAATIGTAETTTGGTTAPSQPSNAPVA